ncbi:MAG: 7-carboxy-7-deazaguanine synthase QueE [Desulfocapsa sp.]|nr:7-carboxy-7-deazaguanine synthase QueE [Desulfocapsa sp.]
MNNQIPTKRVKSDGDTLLIHSIFHTIQGEGPFTGVPAVFVRLGGCNLQCPGCDTEYTKGTETMAMGTIVNNINYKLDGNTTTKLIVITGGEPFRQNISELCNVLNIHGFEVQIETNGVMAPQGDFDTWPTIICSPKTTKLNPKLLPHITAFKYVANWQEVNEHDGLPLTALNHQATPQLARPPEDFDGDVYLQPMDMTEYYDEDIEGSLEEQSVWAEQLDGLVESHNQANLDFVVKSCMQHGYTIQLQIHKLLNLE